MSLLQLALGILPLVFIGSLGATALMIRIAPRLGLLDQPGERRIHHGAIPRAGGIAVFACMVLGFGILVLLGRGFSGSLSGSWLTNFMIAATLLVAVGVMDDRRGLSAWIKLGAQIAAGVIMFLHRSESAGMMFGREVPWVIDLAIHVAWYVALINAFNLIDGMDGLCAGLGIIALTILAVLSLAGPNPEHALVLGVTIAALAGFLRYNFHPARIFLGDAGSMLIGFFIASAGASTVGRNAVVSGLMLPLLLAGVPLFDVFLAVWRRVARRIAASRPGQAAIRVFDPDRHHLHHRLLGWGLNQRQAAFVIYGIALAGSLVALIPVLGGKSMLAVSLAGLVLVGIVGLRYIAPIEFQHTGEGLRAVIRRPQGLRKTVCFYFLFDLVALLAAAGASSWVLAKLFAERWELAKDASSIGILLACGMVGLRCGHAHTRRWMRASKHDFAEVMVWAACGILISFAVQSIAYVDINYRNLAFHWLAAAMVMPLILLPRSIGFALQEGVVDSMHRKRRLKTKRSRRTVLLYGAGDLGELFLSHLRLSAPSYWEDFHFVGFMDDTPELKGRRMRGFPVFGGLADLPKIVERTGANCIFITSSVLPGPVRAELLSMAETLGLEVRDWRPELEPKLLLPGSFDPLTKASIPRQASSPDLRVPSFGEGEVPNAD